MPAAPSLLIVPYRSKTGRLYSQIPVPVAPATTGAGDFTVTRNTTATRFTSAGLIESVASGIPRLDYYTSGGTAGCPALLVEPAATNFARFVQQMTAQDTPTASGGMTITTGSTDFLAPDGTSGSINKYVGGAASGNSQYAYYTGGGIVVTAAGQHTFSLFVKAGATNPLNFCTLNFTAYSGGSGTATSYFSLASGTALTAGASIQDYGNGWYRIISVPYTIASGDFNGTLVFGMAEANNDNSWPASGALNLTAYTWGAQLEVGSVPTSYIPTTAGTGSRSGDLVSVTGAVSGSIGQTAGTFYLDLTYSLRLTSTATRWIQIFGSSNNIGLAVATTNIVRSIVNGQSDILSTPSTSDGVKIAWGYDGSGVVCFVNGTQYTLTNGGAQIITQLNQISLDLSTTTAIGNCRLRAMALYTTRLTNAELATLTTL